MHTSAARWSLASSPTFAAVPSTTRSRASLLVAMTQCASCARFVALREVGLATKHNAPSTQAPNNGTRCGSPSGRTVASQYVSASARRSRASDHGVGVVSSARYGCSAVGVFSAIARLLLHCRRRDILVEPEEVGGVIAMLDLSESIPGRLRIGLANPLLALLAQEAHIRTTLTLTQSRREVAYPRLARSPVLWALVKRSD